MVEERVTFFLALHSTATELILAYFIVTKSSQEELVNQKLLCGSILMLETLCTRWHTS